METGLLEIGKRYIQIKNQLTLGGFEGDLLDTQIVDIISEEILSDIGEVERYSDLKRALVNMFHLGKLSE